MHTYRLVAALSLFSALLAAADRSRILDRYSQLPLSFEPNLGQTDAQVQYIARSAGYNLFLTRTGVVMQLAGPEFLRLRFENSSPAAAVTPLDRQTGVSAYFLGNDPSKWLPEVPRYSRVRYSSIYPGIDVAWYGNGRKMEYDFIVAPGADPGRIHLAYDGARDVRLDPASGDILLTTAAGDFRQKKPRVYQRIDGHELEVAAAYKLSAGKLAFQLAPYREDRELVIDPVLIYSTYLGGNTRIEDLAMDSSGAVYVTGSTVSPVFPTSNAFQPGFGSGIVMLVADAFITKLNPYSGSGPVTLAYSTYLGGTGFDRGAGIAVDPAGAAYISGNSNSTNFPLVNALSSTSSNGFVAKIGAYSGTGKVTLVYSSFLGGVFSSCAKIAVDGTGAAYVVGIAGSIDFPFANGFRTFQAGDGFLARLNPNNGTGSVTVSYSSSFGQGRPSAVAVDSAGAAYVTGSVLGLTFVTANALQATPGGGGDAFVAKVTPFAGGPVSLVYSTFLGGSGADTGTAIAVDSSGSAYVAGYTFSTDFPVLGAYQPNNAGGSDVFVARLNPYNGSGNVTLGFSTYLGGTAADYAYGIAVDAAGSVYVTGDTYSANFPVLDLLPVTFSGILGDAFITKLTPGLLNGLPTLAYSTLLGGNETYIQGVALPETSTGIAIDSTGAIQVAGYTYSPNFPLLNSLQSAYIDVVTDAILDSDGFVARLPKPGTIVKTPVNVTVSSPTVSALPAGQHVIYGQPVSFTATLTSASGSAVSAAAGTVYFIGNTSGAVLCSAQVVAGVASCTSPGPTLPGNTEFSPGSYTVSAGYPGDATYKLGSLTPLTFPIDRAPTTIALSLSPPTPVAGAVTLTAIVAITPPGKVFSAPSGTVTFTGDGSLINGCVARPIAPSSCFGNCPSQFSATCFSPSSSATFGASYSGDSFTGPSTAPSLPVTVKPAPVAVSPAAGSGSTRTFVFTDPRGYQDLGVVNILINDMLDGRRACYLAYSQPLKLLYLVNDTGDALLPGLALNGSGSLGNSQCAISGAGSAVVGNANTLTLTLAVTFSSAFAGNKVVYLAARTVAEDNSGWQPLGVWQALGTPPGIAVVGMSPAFGSGFAQTFTLTFSDTKGWQDLGVVNVLLNDALNGNHACYLAYSTSLDTLYLVNDAGSALLPGMALKALNGPATLSNSQCTVTAASSFGSGNTLTLTLGLSFRTAFAGNRIFYLAARDVNEGNNTGWQALGAWSVN